MLTRLLETARPRLNVEPPEKPTDSAVETLDNSALIAASLMAETSIAPARDCACDARIVASTVEGFWAASTGCPMIASIRLKRKFASFHPIELNARVSATALPAEEAELSLVASICETSSA